MMTELSVAILAGGSSRRMGRDKALLRVADETLLERTARLALSAGMNAFVVGRDCPEEWPCPDVAFVADEYPGMGPLGGLATALRYAGRSVLLLPCDMPSLTADALQWLADSSSSSPFPHGLIVRNGERIEPLFSFYSFSSLSLAREHLRRNLLSMREFIAAGEFGFVDVPEAYIPALRNVNRPEEWEGFAGP